MSSLVPALWPAPPANLPLADDEVQVWRLALPENTPCPPELWSALSIAEQERAGRFRFEKDRAAFAATRGALRHLLAGQLGGSPGQLTFELTPRGKPVLAGPEAARKLCFNVSHTRGLALLALTREREVGVDVEGRRAMADAEEIVVRFFSQRESAEFCALPAEQKPEAFFNCWTRREAYLKATGEGIAQALDQLEVTFAPGQPARLLTVRGNADEAARWHLQALAPGEGYTAALAVKGMGLRVSCWEWNETSVSA